MRSLTTAAALATLLACGHSVAPSAAAPPPAAGAPAGERNVKPGANKQFLDPSLQAAPWVERFEKEGREIYDRRAEIIAATNVKRGDRVADIGAGTGLFTMMFAERVGPQGRVYAVDIARPFLEHIRKRARDTGSDQIEAVLGTERSVELPPGSVDLAFICDTYHHFEYPKSSLASIGRALRPGGQLFLIDFKRIPGKSSEWTFEHVRAGQEIFTAEIEAAGFQKVEELPLLRDNYVVRFRRK
jgi:predicted methyltransferase